MAVPDSSLFEALLGLLFRSLDLFAFPDVVTRDHGGLDSEVIVGRIHKATFDRMEVDAALIYREQ
nr:hypothetical protein [Natronococcus sp. JC468]